MNNLSSNQLMVALNSAIKLNLNEDFIMLLSQELYKRFLSECKENETKVHIFDGFNPKKSNI